MKFNENLGVPEGSRKGVAIPRHPQGFLPDGGEGMINS